jgi:predicted transposase YdaD
VTRKRRGDQLPVTLHEAIPTVSREEIQTMLNLQDVDLKQTRFYQEAFAEGRQEGRQKGQQEGEVTLVLRQLQRRCGELTPGVRE